MELLDYVGQEKMLTLSFLTYLFLQTRTDRTPKTGPILKRGNIRSVDFSYRELQMLLLALAYLKNLDNLDTSQVLKTKLRYLPGSK